MLGPPIRHDLSTDAPVAEGLTVVIGCGNLLRGDDAVGPIAVRHLWERLDQAKAEGDEREDVLLVDGGTAGMDVAFKMRGARRVILIDASATGAEPGTLYRVPGDEVAELPPLGGVHSHQFRWDHALAFARWLLGDECPDDVEVFLIEAADVTPGSELTAPVEAAMHNALDLIWAEFDRPEPATETGVPVEITESGHVRYDAAAAERWFPADALVATMEPGQTELLLMPVIGPEAGGLLVKQRNARGDRAVLIHEHLPLDWKPGRFAARWDEALGALRVQLGEPL